MQCEKENSGVWEKFVNDSRSLKPVEDRHGNVHDNDFGLQRFREFDGFLAIFGLATKFPFGIGAENSLDPTTNHSVIIHD